MRDLIFKLRVLRFMVVEATDTWRSTIWSKDPGALYCCDARECLCGGDTIRQAWSWILQNERPA